MRRFFENYYQNSIWVKVIYFATTIFFLFLADAILSYWAPNLLEEKLGNATYMGLIIATSSAVGLLVDILMPSLLSKFSTSNLLILAVFSSILFAALLILGVSWPVVFVFLLAMAVWGLYFEFIIFVNQLFVAGNVPYSLHSGAWATIGIFKNFAYLLGPLIAGFLISKNTILPGIVAGTSALLGLLTLFIIKNKTKQEVKIDLKNVNIVAESTKWLILFGTVWPVIIISFVLGLVDSFFWTTGALMTGTVLFLYQLPSLFVGFIIVKWGIYKGKKRFAEIFLLLSGLFMALFMFSGERLPVEFIVFVSSLFSAFTYPLIDGVYSDIVGRMGNEKRHLIGFSSAAISCAYIIGPIIAGILTSNVGEIMTFSYLGMFVAIIAIILLIVTPKKLRLSQTEINTWK